MATVGIEPAVGLAELVRRHQAGVWRYLRFLGCDPSSADDLTQETFLAIHRQPFEERSPEATSAYLRTVARNKFLMGVRRARREPAIDNLELVDDAWRRFAREDEGESSLDALRECVERLDGRARQALDLRYKDNRSREEMAREMELSEEGIKSLLRRTREILRKCVEEKLSAGI